MPEVDRFPHGLDERIGQDVEAEEEVSINDF